MASRKLNPDRIRRHMARSTPDEIQIRLCIYDDDYQSKYTEWLKAFGRLMSIKHHNQAHIEVAVFDETFGRYPGDRLIKARQVPKDRWEV